MSRALRGRPPLLRALGREDPPPEIEIGGHVCKRVDIFKHDSWAATARYRGPQGDVICKFNRVQPIFGLPMAWLGRWLARREAFALQQLAEIPGIPGERGPVFVEGRRWKNAVAHAYIAGHPLGSQERPSDEFFPALQNLLESVHRQDIAYVDLHKRENIIVGEDKMPYLVDFQVCFALSKPRSTKRSLLRSILRSLQQGDRYHLAKHIRKHGQDDLVPPNIAELGKRPWWIRIHRIFAVPLRGLRRKFLAALGVRAKGGRAATEAFAEDAFREDLKRAA